MTTVQDIYEAIDGMAPFSTAESWDNSGLLLGRKEKRVQRVLFCLDFTRGALATALQQQADLVLCHHPAISCFAFSYELTDTRRCAGKAL